YWRDWSSDVCSSDLFASHSRPEGVGIVDGFLVEALVFFETFDVGVAAELRGRLELALLLKNRIDVHRLGIDDCFISHGQPQPGGNGFVLSKSARDRRRIFYTGNGRCDWNHAGCCWVMQCMAPSPQMKSPE